MDNLLIRDEFYQVMDSNWNNGKTIMVFLYEYRDIFIGRCYMFFNITDNCDFPLSYDYIKCHEFIKI